MSDFKERFEQTKFWLAAYDGNPIFFLPFHFFVGEMTPSEALEHLKSRQFDNGILVALVSSSLEGVQYIARYDKAKSPEWELDEKAEGILLRLEDRRPKQPRGGG